MLVFKQFKFLLFLSFVIIIKGVPITIDIPEKIDPKGEHWFGPVRRCPPGDDDKIDKCLGLIVKDLTPLVGHGIRELDLEPLDPIQIDQFVYDNKNGPLKINILAKDLSVYDLPRYKNLTFHFDHVKSLMHFVYDNPKIRIDTNYRLTGKALFIPLPPFTGPIHLDLYGLRAEGNMHLYKTLNDNDEVILQLKDAMIDTLTIDEFKLCRLFENNPLLNAFAQSSVHRFGPLVFNAIEPEIAKFTGDVIAHRLLNPILRRLPHLSSYLK